MGKHKFRTRCFMDISIAGEPVGRVVFELFNELCPKATENFKKLCQGACGLGLKTGKPLHYQGCVFHRIIKGFMVQAGDFSNKDGTGGESIYGGTFADESLETPHDRPFLLSMANRGPNTNGSQFFITTAPASHLDKRHVVFGHVLSGEDVVRKIESVPIADTITYRPVKSILISGCGELIPVKKKKKVKEEVEESKRKKKAKKEKKKKQKHDSDDASDSGNEIQCSVRPEEIPDVPLPKFLYRGKLDNSEEQKEETKPDAGSRQIAEAVGREIMRVTRDRQNDHSGRKVKGRGRLCYRSPDARHGSRDKSITPPHWRQASQNTQRMDEQDWKKWHEKRARHRADQAEKAKRDETQAAASPEVSVKSRESRRRPSPVPSATRSRNRSPSSSASPTPIETDMDAPPVSLSNHADAKFVSSKVTSPTMPRWCQDGRLPSPSPKRKRSDYRTDSLEHAPNTADSRSGRRRAVHSPRSSPPAPTRSLQLSPDHRPHHMGNGKDVGRIGVGNESHYPRLPLVDVEYSEEGEIHDDDSLFAHCTSVHQTRPSDSAPIFEEVKTTKLNGDVKRRVSRSPELRPLKQTPQPLYDRQSPARRYVSVIATSPPKRRLSIEATSPPSRLSRHRPTPSPPVSLKSNSRSSTRGAAAVTATVNASYEVPLPPTYRGSGYPTGSQASMSPVLTAPRPQPSPPTRNSRSPRRRERSNSPRVSQFHDEGKLRTQEAVRLPQSPLSGRYGPPLPDQRPQGARHSPAPIAASAAEMSRQVGRARSPPRRHRSSSASRSSSSGHSKHSDSHRGRPVGKPAPPHRSPPPHLVEKPSEVEKVERWRQRHEQLSQKRRVAPTSVFPHPNDDRPRHSERRGAIRGDSGNYHSSRSRSRSFTPPPLPPQRRRHGRSSSSSSSSNSSHSDRSTGPRRRHRRTTEPEKPEVVEITRVSVAAPVVTNASLRESKSPNSAIRNVRRALATSPDPVVKQRVADKPTLLPMAAADDPVIEERIELSKWERSPEVLTEAPSLTERTSWTTSHWQTTLDNSGTIIPCTAKSLTRTILQQPTEPDSVSVLQRLRDTAEHMSVCSDLSEEPVRAADVETVTPTTVLVPRDERRVEDKVQQIDQVNVSITEPTPSPVEQQQQEKSTVEPVAPETVPEGPAMASSSSANPITLPQTMNRPLEQLRRTITVRKRSSSSSSSSADSSASSSSCSSASRSTSRRRSRRRSNSPGGRRVHRRSDYSDSRSRGRGSYYGRYSPIRRSRYSRSRSRSTYRSTIRSGYSSGRHRRRSSSRSRSRSYSRSPDSYNRHHSSRHRRGRRAHRHSGRRMSSSGSGSSRSYSYTPKRR